MARPQNKEEFRRQMAEEFAHVLEEKGLEWKKEWTGGACSPMNGVTKAPYRGTNSFWLSLMAMANGYSDPRWVTSIQVNDVNHRYHPDEHWHIKAGSKATYVEYWYPFDPKARKAYTWPEYREELKNGRSESEFTLACRYTPVFNANQIEGMPALEPVVLNPDVHMDEIVKTLSETMGVEIRTDSDEAYYSPMQDMIHLPRPEQFTDEYAFNATALHELSHSTGHPARLNRPMSAFFGSDGYAYEELVAEIASCFMSTEIRAEPTEEHIRNHKAYVENWVSGIRKKPDILIKAIRDADTAAKAGLLPEQDFEKFRNNTITREKRAVRQAAR